jgi:hypothetical protein
MSDRELLDRPEDLALRRAVAAGRVVRGADRLERATGIEPA